MNTDDRIRVLVVNGGGDEATMGKLRRTLSGGAGIRVAGEVGSGEEALAAARLLSPEVILILADSEMPGIGSLGATRAITEERLPARVVLITENIAKNLVPAVKAGVAALCSPSAGGQELLSTIHRIHQWSPYSLSLQ